MSEKTSKRVQKAEVVHTPEGTFLKITTTDGETVYQPFIDGKIWLTPDDYITPETSIHVIVQERHDVP